MCETRPRGTNGTVENVSVNWGKGMDDRENGAFGGVHNLVFLVVVSIIAGYTWEVNKYCIRGVAIMVVWVFSRLPVIILEVVMQTMGTSMFHKQPCPAVTGTRLWVACVDAGSVQY